MSNKRQVSSGKKMVGVHMVDTGLGISSEQSKVHKPYKTRPTN
jgi:hypothetical protein